MTTNTMTMMKPNPNRLSDLYMKDATYFQVAQRTADLSTYYKTRVGAVLTKKGNIVALAANYAKNIPTNVELSGIGIHAEEAVVNMTSNTVLVGSTIHVARINKSGEPLNSRPCDRRCWPLLKGMGVKYVVYWYDGKIIKERM